jgi:sortase A
VRRQGRRVSDFSSRHWLRTGQSRARSIVPPALVLLGCLILLYVGWQYFAMYREQRALEQAWSEQQQTPPSLTHTAAASPGLTRITIPKIKLDSVVAEGTSNRALRSGPGHLAGSAIPGELGNSVIVAHRDTFFRHVYELNKGDEINIRRNGQNYQYVVTGKKIVEPTDLSVLKATGKPQLTLITCYPIYYIGPAPQRLIVFAKLAQSSPDAKLAPASSGATAQ